MKFSKIAISFLFTAILFTFSCNNEEHDISNEQPLDTLQNIEVDTFNIDIDTSASITIDEKVTKTETEVKKVAPKVKEKEVAVKTDTSSVNTEESIEVIKEKKEVEDELSWEEKGLIINNKQGKEVENNLKGNLLSDAAAEVTIIKGSPCGGENCGKIIHIQNYNSDKNIEVLIEINWKEDGVKAKKKRSYLVSAGDKVEIGCSKKCNDDEVIVFKWKIIGANYKS